MCDWRRQVVFFLDVASLGVTVIGNSNTSTAEAVCPSQIEIGLVPF